MSDEDKRRLAKMLAPHLAWDLLRANVYQYETDATATGAMMFCESVMNDVRFRAARGEAFAVIVVPVETGGASQP